MEVKICGIRTLEDAKMCLDAGADTLGFLVGQAHASTDFIDIDVAKNIISKLKAKKFYATLVTHLEDENSIIALIKEGGFNSIQFHSNITDKQVSKVKSAFPTIRIVRLIHVSQHGEIASNLDEMKIADLYLLDSFNLETNQVGGTGKIHDWKTSAKLVKQLNKPAVLAGGLNPDNVLQAIKTVAPFGVDVNSGVKDSNGFKDKLKVFNFITTAKRK